MHVGACACMCMYVLVDQERDKRRKSGVGMRDGGFLILCVYTRALRARACVRVHVRRG